MISSVNVIKSAVSCGFGHTEEIFNGKFKFIFCVVLYWFLFMIAEDTTQMF